MIKSTREAALDRMFSRGHKNIRQTAREQLVVVIKVPHESRAVVDGEEVAGGARDEAGRATSA